MGSQAAMAEGSRDRYFQDMEENIGKLVPEGVEGRVSYRGFLRETTHQIVGGLRAAMGYCGTRTIADMKAKAKFVQITQAGVIENHPHDIEITEQAPNYWK
jgi:IMP dehydrogenase